MYIFSLTIMYLLNNISILDNKMLEINVILRNKGIEIGSNGIGLVAAQVIIEAYSRIMSCYALHSLYTHT